MEPHCGGLEQGHVHLPSTVKNVAIHKIVMQSRPSVYTQIVFSEKKFYWKEKVKYVNSTLYR